MYVRSTYVVVVIIIVIVGIHPAQCVEMSREGINKVMCPATE